MDTSSLVIASTLLIVPIFISYKEKLGIGKDLIVSVIRAVVQLLIIGYILEYIFKLDSNIITFIMVIFIIINASLNTRKRSGKIKKSFLISFIAIGVSTFITMSVLILSKSINFVPSQVIAVSGMAISNAMVAINLCYENLNIGFREKKNIIEAKLSLGSGIKMASQNIITDSVKMAMMPTIDSAKTLGIVSLPGTMTGLILGGQSPIMAIKFQIMVTFMLISVTSIATIIVGYLGYKSFFNDRYQLIR